MIESTQQSISGYDFGSAQSAKSPLSMEQLGQLEHLVQLVKARARRHVEA